jgi:hypothetical protein
MNQYRMAHHNHNREASPSVCGRCQGSKTTRDVRKAICNRQSYCVAAKLEEQLDAEITETPDGLAVCFHACRTLET